MKKRVRSRGFTLVELAISLVFISILSVTVVLLIQSTTASYRRGMILNEINTVGMDLVDEMRFSVQNSSSYSIVEMCRTFYGDDSECEKDNANSFVTVTKRATVKEKDASGREVLSINNMPVYGAFCTGTYTYIWNSGYFEPAGDFVIRSVEGADPVSLGVKGTGAEPVKTIRENFRLLKIYDAERTICVNAMRAQSEDLDKKSYVALKDYDNNDIGPQFVIDRAMLSRDSESDSEYGVELMSQNDLNDLVLYDLYVAKPALSTTRKNFFYPVTFILGTKRGGVNIDRAGDNCKPPSDEYSELEYCAINKFNFAVEAGGQ